MTPLHFRHGLPSGIAVVAVLAPAGATGAAEPARWWLAEPVRLIQTNLPETFSTLDSDRLSQQVADFPANTLLFQHVGDATAAAVAVLGERQRRAFARERTRQGGVQPVHGPARGPRCWIRTWR